MKKRLILAIVLLASTGFAVAEDMAFTGRVTAEACVTDLSKAGNSEHKGCATGCRSRGGGVALGSPDGSHFLEISGEFAGTLPAAPLQRPTAGDPDPWPSDESASTVRSS